MIFRVLYEYSFPDGWWVNPQMQQCKEPQSDILLYTDGWVQLFPFHGLYDAPEVTQSGILMNQPDFTSELSTNIIIISNPDVVLGYHPTNLSQIINKPGL